MDGGELPPSPSPLLCLTISTIRTAAPLGLSPHFMLSDWLAARIVTRDGPGVPGDMREGGLAGGPCLWRVP